MKPNYSKVKVVLKLQNGMINILTNIFYFNNCYDLSLILFPYLILINLLFFLIKRNQLGKYSYIRFNYINVYYKNSILI